MAKQNLPVRLIAVFLFRHGSGSSGGLLSIAQYEPCEEMHLWHEGQKNSQKKKRKKRKKQAGLLAEFWLELSREPPNIQKIKVPEFCPFPASIYIQYVAKCVTMGTAVQAGHIIQVKCVASWNHNSMHCSGTSCMILLLVVLALISLYGRHYSPISQHSQGLPAYNLQSFPGILLDSSFNIYWNSRNYAVHHVK